MGALEEPTIDFIIAYRSDSYAAWQYQQAVNDQHIREFIEQLPTSWEFNVYQRVEK